MRAHHVLVSGNWTYTDRWSLDLGTYPEDWSIWEYAATNAFALLADGRPDEARVWMSHVAQDNPEWGDPLVDVTRMQLQGLFALSEGKTEEGLRFMQEAAETEAALPYEFGPPRLPMPSHEAWGNALLAAGQTNQAREVLAEAESRTPGRLTVARARALLDAE